MKRSSKKPKRDILKKLKKEKKTVKQYVMEKEVEAKRASGKYKKMPFVTVICGKCGHKVYYKCSYCVLCHSTNLTTTSHQPQYKFGPQIPVGI